jgi:hypothetical protein
MEISYSGDSDSEAHEGREKDRASIVNRERQESTVGLNLAMEMVYAEFSDETKVDDEDDEVIAILEAGIGE